MKDTSNPKLPGGLKPHHLAHPYILKLEHDYDYVGDMGMGERECRKFKATSLLFNNCERPVTFHYCKN